MPHAYLAAAYQAKLNNFLARGSQIVFDAPPPPDEPEEPDNDPNAEPMGQIPLPDPDAESRIPKSWITPERILNVFYESKKGAGYGEVEFRNYRNLPEDPMESIGLVRECFFKWGDLPYSNCEYLRFVRGSSS